MLRFAAALSRMLACGFSAQAKDVTIASWNLGWHMDLATANQWIDLCSKRYVKDATADVWREGSDPDSKPGWFVDAFKIDGWDTTRFPVCGVYRDRDNKIVFVKPAGYQERHKSLARSVASSVPADIIAFQEVNGEDSIREILPDHGNQYDFCTVVGYKVQRIVIAWKKSVGTKVSCAIEDPVSLPGNPESERPRPGLALSLDIDGTTVRILSVHLKSRCVSPFENGRLASPGDHCPILQQQVEPLEAWIERETADDAKVVLMGDLTETFGMNCVISRLSGRTAARQHHHTYPLRSPIP